MIKMGTEALLISPPKTNLINPQRFIQLNNYAQIIHQHRATCWPCDCEEPYIEWGCSDSEIDYIETLYLKLKRRRLAKFRAEVNGKWMGSMMGTGVGNYWSRRVATGDVGRYGI